MNTTVQDFTTVFRTPGKPETKVKTTGRLTHATSGPERLKKLLSSTEIPRASDQASEYVKKAFFEPRAHCENYKNYFRLQKLRLKTERNFVSWLPRRKQTKHN